MEIPYTPMEALSRIRLEHPEIRIESKADSIVMKIIDRFLKIVSLGKVNSFMSHYTTTLGYTIYLPSEFGSFSPTERVAIYLHEAVHVRQAKRYTRLLFSLMYLFLPIPIGFAWARIAFEWEAYSVNIRVMADRYGIDFVKSGKFKNFIIEQFTGPSYIYMCLSRKYIEKLYTKLIYELEQEEYMKMSVNS